jgi:hypothetical protein
LGVGTTPAIPADPDFYHALTAVAASDKRGGVSNRRLGQWLSKNNGKIVGKLKLTRAGMKAGYPLWRVIDV